MKIKKNKKNSYSMSRIVFAALTAKEILEYNKYVNNHCNYAKCFDFKPIKRNGRNF